jgi:hypothetical protein
MTLSTTTIRNDYTGNGAAVTFPYTYKVFASSELRVLVDGVLQTITTHYSVTGVGAESGGNVVFVTAPANGVSVAILATIALTQTTDLVNETGFFQDRIEQRFDKLCRADQLAAEELSRALTLPEDEAGSSVTTTLPSLEDRKGHNLSFDATTGAPVASTPSSAAVSAAMEPVVGSATLALARAAMGPWGDALVTATGSTTERSLADRAAGVINVKDFGATGDGVTDDTAAIQAAIDYQASLQINAPGDNSGYTKNKRPRIIFPGGKYLVHELVGTSEMHLEGDDVSGMTTLAYNGAGGVGSFVVHVDHAATNATWGALIGLRIMGWSNNLSTDAIAENCVKCTLKGVDFSYRIERCMFNRCFGDGIKILASMVNVYIDRCRWDAIGGWCVNWDIFASGQEGRPVVFRDWTIDNNITGVFATAAENQGYYNSTLAEWGLGALAVGINSQAFTLGASILFESGRFEGNKKLKTYASRRQLFYINTPTSNALSVVLDRCLAYTQTADGAVVVRSPNGVNLSCYDCLFTYLSLYESAAHVRGRLSVHNGHIVPTQTAGLQYSFPGSCMVGGKLLVTHDAEPGATSVDNDTYLYGDFWFLKAAGYGPTMRQCVSTGVSYNYVKTLTSTAVVTAGVATVSISTAGDRRNIFVVGLNIKLAGAGPAAADLTCTVTNFDPDAGTITVSVVPSTSVGVCVITAVPATWLKMADAYLSGSVAWNPASIANGAQATTTIAVTGAALGDYVEASASIDTAGLVLTGRVSAVDTVTITLSNTTGGAVDLGNFTARVKVAKP